VLGISRPSGARLRMTSPFDRHALARPPQSAGRGVDIAAGVVGCRRPGYVDGAAGPTRKAARGASKGPWKKSMPPADRGCASANRRRGSSTSVIAEFLWRAVRGARSITVQSISTFWELTPDHFDERQLRMRFVAGRRVIASSTRLVRRDRGRRSLRRLKAGETWAESMLREKRRRPKHQQAGRPVRPACAQWAAPRTAGGAERKATGSKDRKRHGAWAHLYTASRPSLAGISSAGSQALGVPISEVRNTIAVTSDANFEIKGTLGKQYEASVVFVFRKFPRRTRSESGG